MITDLGPEDIAKYPFVLEAGSYLKQKGFTLEQFGNDSDLKPIVKNALERIIDAADGKVSKNNASKSNLDIEVFTFLMAVILLRQTSISNLIRKFSLQEARKAEKTLEDSLSKIMPGDVEYPTAWAKEKNRQAEIAIKIIKEISKVDIQKQDDYCLVPVPDYLTRSIHFHEQEWKLVNRQVDKGLVMLSSHQTVRLFRIEIDNYIRERIQTAPLPSISGALNESVEQLKEFAKKFVVQYVETTEQPPCIKHALDILHKGENLPHSGRFMLATYLLNKGQTIEEIAPLFKNAPDYNEKITLYQLKHLAGNFGSGTKYACPSCEKLKTENLCFATPECAGIINPLQFGRKKISNA